MSLAWLGVQPGDSNTLAIKVTWLGDPTPRTAGLDLVRCCQSVKHARHKMKRVWRQCIRMGRPILIEIIRDGCNLLSSNCFPRPALFCSLFPSIFVCISLRLPGPPSTALGREARCRGTRDAKEPAKSTCQHGEIHCTYRIRMSRTTMSTLPWMSCVQPRGLSNTSRGREITVTRMLRVSGAARLGVVVLQG